MAIKGERVCAPQIGVRDVPHGCRPLLGSDRFFTATIDDWELIEDLERIEVEFPNRRSRPEWLRGYVKAARRHLELALEAEMRGLQ